MGKRGDNLTETPEAASAFAAYVALGPNRSLRWLAADLVKQDRYKTETTAFNVLAQWSGKHRWQERIAGAATAEAEAMLHRASEIDAATFFRTSELLAERVGYSTHHHVDAVIKMRESVRRPAPKGDAATVNVNVSVEVELRRLVEAAARDAGLDPDEAIAEAQRHLAGARA